MQDSAVREKIAARAYAQAEREGFLPGREVAHWLQAEAETQRELESLETQPRNTPEPENASAPAAEQPKRAVRRVAPKPAPTEPAIEIAPATPKRPRKKAI